MVQKLIKEMITEALFETRVCLPGKIEAYNTDTHLASIQPLIKRKPYKRKNSVLLPTIDRVPVVFPRSGKALIRLPIAVGDIVTLVFSDRDLENWIGGKGEAKDPLSTRIHHLSDAYAIPGGYPEGKPWKAKNPGALEIIVKPGTKIAIGNETDELLQLAHDAFTELKNAATQLKSTLTQIQVLTVTTGGVTSTVPNNAALFATISGQVDTIIINSNSVITKLGNIKV